MNNSIATKYPAVAAQWHPTRNDTTLTPAIVAGKTSLMAWWICAAGHEWEERVASRTSTIEKWKKGNPAACRYCDPVMADEVIVEHKYPCGHTARIRLRNAKLNPERCWDCERPFYEERKREARKARRKANPARTPVSATPTQRAAQRQIVGLLNRGMGIDLTGVSIYRDDGLAHIYDSAPTAEIEGSLEALAVPYSKWVVPLAPKGRDPAYELTVAWSDIDKLQYWAPTAAKMALDVLEKMPKSFSEKQVEAQNTVRLLLDRARVCEDGGLYFDARVMTDPEDIQVLTDALDSLKVVYQVGIIIPKQANPDSRKKRAARLRVVISPDHISQLQVWLPQLVVS